MNNRGQVTFYLFFIILAIIIILLVAVMAPFGSLVNTELYEIGEGIMIDANETLQGINDDDVRNRLQANFDTALDSTEDNIKVNNGIFQYGWIIVLVILALFLFLFSRRLVEAGYMV